MTNSEPSLADLLGATVVSVRYDYRDAPVVPADYAEDFPTPRLSVNFSLGAR